MPKQFAALTRAVLLVIACGSVTPFLARGNAARARNEQILSYHSDVTVNQNATLLVRETISAFATGRQIRHGIYRDFPTRYQDRFGNAYTVHFDVVSAERDDQPEDYHLEKLSNGLRIYLGKSSEFVSPGEHTYELAYRVDREIGFFPDHDELYWNVTGNGWAFAIQEASATVHLPKGIARDAILLDAYTGPQGSAATDYAASADRDGNANFRTTRPLGPHDGLTIVVRWPKGFVRPPTDEEKFHYFVEDNQATLIGIAGLILVLIYYTVAWLLVGRDPAKGVIVPRYEPPPGFSPAAIRYANRMAFDQKALAADIVDLAVKKRLAIQEDGSGVYTLTRLEGPPADAAVRSPEWSAKGSSEITPDEKLLLDKLFASGGTLRLERANHARVGGAIEALHRALRSSLEKVYFVKNGRYLIPGLLISFLTIVRAGFSIQGAQKPLALFISFWVLIWSLGCAVLLFAVFAAWRNALSDPYHKAAARTQALLVSAFSVPFLIGEFVGLVGLARAASPAVVLVLILLVLANYLFHYLLKAPTRSGRALLDQIEGFRMFLAAVEEDRYKALNPPEKTPELFEKFLPYAMALNVEKAWSERLAAVLTGAAQPGATGYSPLWYSGPNWSPMTASAFATSLGSSFSSAISSASTAPGSSSGGGGGGSSGGGGGGGGGGGW
jgi:uncharacterized membrane protein YgcG